MDSADRWLTARPPETIGSAEVTLRRAGAGILDELVEAVNDSLDELRPWMPWAQEPATRESIGAFLEQADGDWDAGREFQFAVRGRRGDEPQALLGFCGLHDRIGPGGLEIGYWVRTDCTGRGVATSAASGLRDAAPRPRRRRPGGDPLRRGQRSQRGDPTETGIPARSDRDAAALDTRGDRPAHDLGPPLTGVGGASAPPGPAHSRGLDQEHSGWAGTVRGKTCLTMSDRAEGRDVPGAPVRAWRHAWGWALATAGAVGVVAALSLDGAAARSAASQVWPAFVLVAGLLLVGLVADRDGLFAAVGHRLAVLAPNGVLLFAGSAALVAVVTALLNLDTSVVFLTPVLVYAAKSRGQGETALLVGCLLLSNAGSLLLPGSNLTNLIVLGQLHLSGGQFFAHMVLPWTAAVLLTATVVAIAHRRSLRTAGGPAQTDRADQAEGEREPATIGVGAVAVVAVTVLVLVLRSPAVPVAAVGVVAVSIRLAGRRISFDRVRDVLGLPVLFGLFGVATALGTLGRSWSGPATLLSHLDAVGTAVVAAVASVLVNNLPAAALLAARVPPHPYPLLIGLDIGPNLFVTGSLAWILWYRTARSSGSDPPVGRAVGLGLITVPVSMAAALAILAAIGSL